MRRVVATLLLSATALGQQPVRLSSSPDLTCERCGPQYVWIATQTAAALGIGVAWYWYDKDLNSPDWDFPGIDERLDGSAVRFDNNTFTINNVVHPLDGGVYYLIGRTNRLGVLGSSLLSVFASSTWEYILEWREKVSINDLVFTPTGGIATGEFTYQLGRHLFRPARHHEHRFLLAFSQAGHREGEADPSPRHGVVLEAELATLRGYLRPRRFTRFFAGGNFTELALRSHFSADGAADVELWVTAVLAGVYSQDFTGEPGNLRGTGGRLGLAMALEHTQRWLPEPQDRIAAAHLPGLAANLRICRGRRGVEFDAVLHPDLAAVDSLGWHDWRARNPDRSVRTVLENNDYYFGFGFTTVGSVRAWSGPFEVGSRVRFGSWDSVEGLDRFEEAVAEDVTLDDQVFEASGWVGWRSTDAPLTLRVGVDAVRRRGRIDGERAERSFRRGGVLAGLAF